MRVAALYDIHGNLPALEAVLDEVRRAGVDQIVVGGDVLPGPMPRESLDMLLSLEIPVQFIYGNGERAVLAQIDAKNPHDVTYWGTTSGKPLPEPLQDVLRWTGRELRAEHVKVLRSWPGTLRIEVPRVGSVLFCHATPRSETEGFTRLTPEDRLLSVFQGLDVALVVCGHTHMQFDRMVGATRVVNAGSVGVPFGPPGADWLLLGGDIQLRHMPYNLAQAADRIRASAYPQAHEFARSILEPPLEEDMLRSFTNISFQ
jgi:predicted phosphodiesterase